MNTLLLAFGAISVSVAAQFALKAGMSAVAVQAALAGGFKAKTAFTVLSEPMVATGLLIYVLGAILWLGVLANMEVSKAYPLVGAGFALTAVVGWIVGEQVSLLRLSGVALICVGVALVGRS